MPGYYQERLAAERLQRCYELAPERVQQYLRAEVEFVIGRLHRTDAVLDLGCGYGRTIPEFAEAAGYVVGIDTSYPSLQMARERLRAVSNTAVACMDASRLGFTGESFDQIACIQNGISAFHADQGGLVREALRVLRPGGRAFFSSYSARFWEPRLDWFERQADAGLIGEIDRARTGNGVIVCKDGFTSRTVGPEEFRALVANLDVGLESVEVDASSWFHIVMKA